MEIYSLCMIWIIQQSNIGRSLEDTLETLLLESSGGVNSSETSTMVKMMRMTEHLEFYESETGWK